MRILHLSTSDKGGGAADAAYRLHCNMRAHGIDSRMAVLNKTTDDGTVVALGKRKTLLDRVRRKISKICRKRLQRSYLPGHYFYMECPGLLSARRIAGEINFVPDVIIAHWISNFITTATLHDLSRVTGAPVLWYLMDMGPLTGGCHYAFDCTGYTRQCGDCPQLHAGRAKRDLSARQWQVRHDAVQGMEVTPVIGSSWLQHCLEKSSIFQGKKGEKILLGIDTDVFIPMAPTAARQIFDLPADKKVVFFGASSLHEERKGVRYLIEALHKLYGLLEGNERLREEILVVTAGSSDSSTELGIPFEHRHIGFLSGDAMLAAGYQAADIFVNASVEDAGPMMINEALLCGTPVVSFDMGVAPDLVHTGRTGYRARLRDADDMAIGLLQLLAMDDASRSTMRSECRSLGLQLCHPEVQVRAFMELCASRVAQAQSGSSRGTSEKTGK